MNRYTVIALILGLILVVGLVVQQRSGKNGGRVPGDGANGSNDYSPWVTLPQQGQSRRERDRKTVATNPLPQPIAAPPHRSEFGALPGERALIFATPEDYRAFLEAAEEAGFRILGSIPGLNAVRVGGVRDDESLAKLFDEIGAEPPEVGGNFSVSTPKLPVPEDRDPLNPEPFRNQTVEWLGLDGIDLSTWGEGVRIAVLDGGVAPVFTDREIPNTPVHADAPDPEGLPAMHGTAVSSIIVSDDPRIPGIAPAAELLGFSVMGENGLSDTFTLANGIVAAVDAGVDLINASLGSAGDSAVVRQAVEYAEQNGVLIVASAGNEQGSEVVFPARYPETIAVGAVDALGRQLTFSNSGEAMGIGAPGQEIYAFGANGSPVSFSGTSASAPFVTAAIAAVMSQEPNLTAHQAADLLIEHANEAGAPGFDTHYGHGNLNIGRVLNRNEKDRRDVAVASHHVTQDANGQPLLQVVVENRGTVASRGSRLDVDLGGSARVAVLPSIQPNEVFASEFPLIPAELEADEAFQVQSILGVTDDVNERNNSLSTDISSQLAR